MIQLSEVQQLAVALLNAQDNVEKMEGFLKEAKERVRLLQEESIPAAMQELELKKFTLQSGEEVTVKKDVYASISAANKDAAFAWLNENGFGGMIKTDISVQFGRDSAGEVEATLAMLKGEGLEPEVSVAVNAKTLKAFLREQLEKGERDLPLDLFSARPVDIAQIKAPSKKKGS
jgi:hypothetical protein